MYITVEDLVTLIVANRIDLETAANTVEDSHIEFASAYLDSIDWVGSRVASSQSHAWPRSYVPIDRFDSSLGYRDNSTIPTEILLIVSELAIRYSSDPSITDDSATGIAVTGVTLPDFDPSVLGGYIRDRIAPFVKNSGGLRRVN